MPCCNASIYKRLQRLLSCPCSLYHPRYKTEHRDLQELFLRFLPFYHRRYQPRISGYNAACATPGASQRRSASSAYQIPAPRRTLYRSSQPPIIIRYIRVQGCACYGSMPDGATHRRPCRPGGVSVSTCTGSARRLSIWHRVSLTPSTRRGSPAAKARRAARNHQRRSRFPFRAFAR